MSTPESHPEKFPPAKADGEVKPEDLKKLEDMGRYIPDARLPDDPEARRKLIENMFKGALACHWGEPRNQTVAEFEKDIDDHNAGVKHINEPKKPISESQE